MVESYFVKVRDASDWGRLLVGCLEECETFVVHTPDAAHAYDEGQVDWANRVNGLHGVAIEPCRVHPGWCNLRCGRLDLAARRLFGTIPWPLERFPSAEPRIWYASFSGPGGLALVVEDFTDVLLDLPDNVTYRFEEDVQPRIRFRPA